MKGCVQWNLVYGWKVQRQIACPSVGSAKIINTKYVEIINSGHNRSLFGACLHKSI